MGTTTDIYINKIATALWQGRAALMVGAGLSREADRTSDAVPKFPLWSELKGGICAELGYPGNNQTDVLALASQYEALLGRQELEMFLRRKIPDMEFLPGNLHGNIMKLPWADVFTTNYDSLLERADAKYAGSVYDLVQTSEDIAICRKEKRIVKLHGTFAIAGSFVFTEEDYRTYPTTHAPFVNMVQEAMMENVFCLLGFSGTDVNFLHWLGWVRDNLGAMMPRIYLCGILNLTEAQRKDLDRKNIAIVDLSDFASTNEYPDNDARHKKAIEIFIEKLKNHKPSSPMEWGNESISSTGNWEILREERQNYPGWVIMPYEIRERHRHFIQHHRQRINSCLSSAKPWESLCMVYELNWHIEQLLDDIYKEEVKLYFDVLLKVNPFPNYLAIDNAITPNKEDARELAVWRESWVGLAFILVRWAREHGNKDLRKQLMQYLKEIKHLSELWMMQWYYEKCKEAMFSFSWDLALDELQNWIVPVHYPYWQLQKAALYATLDRLNEAESLVSIALAEVRSRFRGSDMQNIQLQSWESWGLHLLRYIRGGQISKKKLDQSDLDRWGEIASWKGSPQTEISYLSGLVQQQKQKPHQHTKHGFDPGHETVKYSFSSTPWWSGSFAWFRIHDLAPLPVRCGVALLDEPADIAAAGVLWKLHSVYATAWLLQFTHEKDLDAHYTRLAIAILPKDEIMNLYKICINSFHQLNAWILGGSAGKKKTWGNSFARERMLKELEIISRLCFRLDAERLDEVFLLAVRCYSNSLFQTDETYARLLTKLWQRVISSMGVERLNSHILTLLRLPLSGEAGLVVGVSPQSWPEPFVNLNDIYGDSSCDVEQQANWVPEIARLTTLATENEGEIRRRALCRLMTLYFAELLTSEQVENLANAIWRHLDASGLPKDVGYSIWGVTSWPGAEKHDALEKLRKTLLSHKIASEKEIVSEYWLNLMYSSKCPYVAKQDREKISWHEEELHKFLDNATKCIDRLEYEVQERGHHDYFGMSVRAKQEIQQIGQCLLDCVIPFIEVTQEEKGSIISLLQRLEEKDTQLISVKLAMLLYVEQDFVKASILLGSALNSYVREDVIEAYKGIRHWLGSYQQKIVDDKMPESLLVSCAWNLESRRSLGLIPGLKYMGNIIKEFPDQISDKCLEPLVNALFFLKGEAQLYAAYMPGLPEAFGIKQESWPDLQYASAYLAKAVHEYYEENGKAEPPVLNEWREMCKKSVLPEVWHLAW